MAINISVQYNGGLLPDIILLTQGYYHRGKNPFKYHVEALSLQPMKQYDLITTMLNWCTTLFLFCFRLMSLQCD